MMTDRQVNVTLLELLVIALILVLFCAGGLFGYVLFRVEENAKVNAELHATNSRMQETLVSFDRKLFVLDNDLKNANQGIAEIKLNAAPTAKGRR